jgi:hypothetical protein
MAKLKVFVRPIPRESVFKIHNFSSNGKSMGKTKVDSMPKILSFTNFANKTHFL